MDESDELVDRELVDRLANAGWHLGGWTRYPDGTVKAGLRPAPESSGEPERHIYGTDINDAFSRSWSG